MLLVGAPGVGAAPDDGARVSVEPGRAAPGQQVAVRLVGWPRTTVSVSVCGAGGRRGSADCDQGGTRSTTVPESGVDALALTVAVPPAPCPCVVLVRTSAGTVARTAPLEIDGAPTGTLPPRPADGSGPAPTVSAAIEDGPPWGALVGGAGSGELVVTVRNPSDRTLHGLHATAGLGRDASAGAPIDVGARSDVPPGGEVVWRVAFDLGAPAVGTYVVAGRVDGLSTDGGFEATTVRRPWGLLALAIGGLAGVVVVRRRRRSRTAVA